jgi:glucokinase-like ROK family protein
VNNLPRNRTGNQSLLREINLAMVMMHLQNAPASRATLAEKTGLNKTTVSSLVQELLDYNLLREADLSASGVGRPAILLEFNPDGGYFVSGEVGVDFISVICTNFATKVIWRLRTDTCPTDSQAEILETTLTLLQQAVDFGQESGSPFLGLALGAPGLVDRQTGTLLFAPNLKWRDVPLRKILQEKFSVPVFVDNEANLAALGEHYFGAAKNHHEVLYISAGVGLGGGVIRDGQLFSGGAGFGGEFGHMTMDPDGIQCNCGNTGCWETQVSQSALFRYVRQAIEIEAQPSQLVSQTAGDPAALTVPQVVEAARSGDAVALYALGEAGRYLGIGIAALVNAFNPNLIVFGGILSLASDFLLPLMTAEIHRRALPYLWSDRTVQVVVAEHGVDACVMGGVARCYENIIGHPGQVAR